MQPFRFFKPFPHALSLPVSNLNSINTASLVFRIPHRSAPSASLNMARNTLLLLALLLLFSLASAARRQPLAVADSALETQEMSVETEPTEMPESCEGVGEEECLMRRTLVAHTDYIYTQGAGKKQP
ncbi:phytosulfokines-like [Aristolochia californica]|uniref:phytosulfokines-like n=1 Tax=Aristolochia californica TaxID=171875 RepID=UPI0035E24659